MCGILCLVSQNGTRTLNNTCDDGIAASMVAEVPRICGRVRFYTIQNMDNTSGQVLTSTSQNANLQDNMMVEYPAVVA